MLSTDADLISWCILKTRLVKDFIFNEFCLFLFKGGAVMFYQKSIQDILKECDTLLLNGKKIALSSIQKNIS